MGGEGAAQNAQRTTVYVSGPKQMVSGAKEVPGTYLLQDSTRKALLLMWNRFQ